MKLNKHHPTILGDYRIYVEGLFEQNSDIVVSNGLPEHAAVLMSVFFRKAKKEVIIFCKDLSAEIYSQMEVIASILEAVRRGVIVRIVTQAAPQAVELLCDLRGLHKADPERVQIRRCKPGSRESQLAFNFAVMDAKAFRYESNRENIKADACANNPGLATSMANAFEKYFAAAVPEDEVRDGEAEGGATCAA